MCEFHQIDLPDGERGAQAHRLTPPQNPHTDACMIIINAIRDKYEIKSHSIIILECEMF